MGGVIVRTEDRTGRAAWEQRLGLEAGELEGQVFEGKASRRASVGDAAAQDVWQEIAARHTLSDEQRQQLERDFWSGDVVDEDLIEVIRGLRPRYRTALLSNAWPDLRQQIEDNWGFADAFDEIVISAEVGVAKPDPEIYHLTLERLGTAPERAVFVDDFKENIQAAAELGMHAIRFHAPQQVLRELFRLLGQQLGD